MRLLLSVIVSVCIFLSDLPILSVTHIPVCLSTSITLFTGSDLMVRDAWDRIGEQLAGTSCDVI